MDTFLRRSTRDVLVLYACFSSKPIVELTVTPPKRISNIAEEPRPTNAASIDFEVYKKTGV